MLIAESFAVLLAIAINSYILYYLHNLEKIGCKCALNWRRNFIAFFIGFSLILAILGFFKIDALTSTLFLTLFAVLSIANVVIILQYIVMLKKEKCTCSESLAKLILQFIATLYAFIYIMVFIIFFYSGFKMSSIISLSKELSTNNPNQILKVLNRTFTGLRSNATKK